jgi:hypothetical protein
VAFGRLITAIKKNPQAKAPCIKEAQIEAQIPFLFILISLVQ